MPSDTFNELFRVKMPKRWKNSHASLEGTAFVLRSAIDASSRTQEACSSEGDLIALVRVYIQSSTL